MHHHGHHNDLLLLVAAGVIAAAPLVAVAADRWRGWIFLGRHGQTASLDRMLRPMAVILLLGAGAIHLAAAVSGGHRHPAGARDALIAPEILAAALEVAVVIVLLAFVAPRGPLAHRSVSARSGSLAVLALAVGVVVLAAAAIGQRLDLNL